MTIIILIYYSSGTEEQFEEREQLLTEHTSILDEKIRMKGAEARKNEEKDNQGKEIRKAAMENIRPRNDDEQDGNQYDYLYYPSAV